MVKYHIFTFFLDPSLTYYENTRTFGAFGPLILATLGPLPFLYFLSFLSISNFCLFAF